ncbi:hypothetical protein [Mycolicibacterium sphagni]|uniref:hypothetical protein n=1 Tax=Mycolicibacterium sphagni TaxID=1786 RepID=UPI0021F2CAD6|nr:hypothetical protein [Mycolicibacterium sphagni]MCV7174770.1 hypothetical protein [Mycolicibacterium sphagni]
MTVTTFPVSGDWLAVGDPALTADDSAPVVSPLGALVTFTPRLPAGFIAYLDAYPVDPNVSAVQTVTLLYSPTGGTWCINIGGVPTADIPYNASAATVQTTLQAHAAIGAGNATVAAGPDAYTFVVTFTGALANQPIDLMVGDGTDLTGVDAPYPVTVINTTLGSTARTAPTGLVIPTRQGRIWNGRLASIDRTDSLNVDLISNDPTLNLSAQNVPTLIYDVTFTQVSYDSITVGLQNFAFSAPVDDTPICITDPTLPKLAWQYSS